jgi:hypothetical protein
VRLTSREFRAWENKCVTLIGMAGVGKTRLSGLVRKHHWFHYSADYRIGTRYLAEPILDNIKRQAMRVPFLRDLFRSDSIYICNNITVDNLEPVTSFLGNLGDPERGGLPLGEFKRRQGLYREALAAAMKDVPEFIRKAREIYGYRHFVNDTAGGLCELDSEEVIDLLAKHTLILYVRPTETDERKLLESAGADLRPLCYREAFLDEQLSVFLRERGIPYVALIEPGDFYRWALPTLYAERVPRYERIARVHGYTVTTEELKGVRDEADFLALVERTLDRRS